MAMIYNTLDADNEEIDFQRMLEESIQLKHKITKTVKQDIPEEYNTDVHECPICYDEFMTMISCLKSHPTAVTEKCSIKYSQLLSCLEDNYNLKKNN